AQAVVALGVVVGRWSGLRDRTVGVSWCGSVERSVWALFVVVLAELVELALELSRGAGCWAGREPPLLGLVEPLDLALGLRVSRGAVLLSDAEGRQEVFERVA